MRRQGPRRRHAVLGSLAAALLALVSVAAGAPAQAKTPDMPRVPGPCNGQYRTSQLWKVDVSHVADDSYVVFDGKKIELTPWGWRYYNRKDASQTLWFHSLNWVAYLALTDPKTAVDVIVERDRALPDPGRYASKAERQSTGWTQGAFRTRQETVTCLWYLTRDKRLVPIAERLANAAMDPARYPGLPYYPVQNHGAMANISLYQAGKAFDRPDWIAVAMKRLKADMPEVFTSCGMMWEQSSTYQEHNVSLWMKAARLLEVGIDGPQEALDALVRPDGVLESIGDGQQESGFTPSGKTLWCPETGWAAGTVRDDTLGPSHYILRFGPPNDDHGHDDHMSVTWFAAGVPVLSDRGLYDKRLGARREFAQGSLAHSMLLPEGENDYNAYTYGERIGRDHAYRLTDSFGSVSRSREVSVRGSTLTVRDEASGAKRWVQHWQLAPGWKPTKSGAVYTDGTQLTIDCAKRRAVQVEAFTAWRTAVPAWDLQCLARGYAVDLTTTLTVTPPGIAPPTTDDTTA